MEVITNQKATRSRSIAVATAVVTCTKVTVRSLRCIPQGRCITPRRVITRRLATTRPLHVITLRHPVITGLATDAPVMDALITAVARVTVAATGMVAGTTAGVATTAAAITAAATAIALRLQVRDPEAEMALAPVVAGMAIPAVAVAADHVPALDPAAVATGEMAVSVVVVTADRAAATAELQNGAPRSAVFLWEESHG